MKMKYLVLEVVVVAGLAVGGYFWWQSQQKSQQQIDMKYASRLEQTLYTIGQIYADRVGYMQFTEAELEYVFRGIREHLRDRPDFLVGRDVVQELIHQRTTVSATVEKEKGKKFVEKYLKEGGLITNSGLAYKVLSPGNDKRANPSDAVTVEYEGSFVDGQIFETTVGKDQVTFPIDAIMPGWQEALELIGEGGKVEFVVPSSLAYGDAGSLPKIPGGATLVFKLTLFKITRG